MPSRNHANGVPDELIAELQTIVDAVPALVRFCRQAVGADSAILFEAGDDGLASPVAADPEIPLRSFSLESTDLEVADFSDGPIPPEALRLPSTVVTSITQSVARVLFVRSPVAQARRSGVLFLWAPASAASAPADGGAGLMQRLETLAPVFVQMLNQRRTVLKRRLAVARFQDLFNSVPSGIVVFEGDGRTGLVNQAAAALLDIHAGEHKAADIGRPMRALRERCENAAELDAIYAPLQGQLDYAVKAVWRVGTQRYEVDSHPILGNGRNGRIWLFANITAQQAVEDDLRALTLTDPLTGLNNRRQFTAAGNAAFARPWSQGQPLAVLMADIDHFKQINDRHGHPAGDEVLRQVAWRMRSVLRETDLLARLGGEEFAVILEKLTGDKIVAMAERLRAVIAAEPVIVDAVALPVYVSIGCALRQESDRDLESLLARADRALYAAKRGGRNRVLVDGNLV